LASRRREERVRNLRDLMLFNLEIVNKLSSGLKLTSDGTIKSATLDYKQKQNILKKNNLIWLRENK